MTSKARLHELVEQLPDEETAAAARFLEYLRDVGSDPMRRVLDEAPEDDEPTTPEEDASAEEAWQEYKAGKSISAEEAKRLLLP